MGTARFGHEHENGYLLAIDMYNIFYLLILKIT
jgi:hypothetical protein